MYDVIIIGAGSMGTAASYFLAKQQKRVLCIDAFDPPHTEASHHGETRIIRYAYGEGADYVDLALRAKQLWQELETLTGEQLLLPVGVLNMTDKDAPFLHNVKQSALQHHLHVESLTSTDVNERFHGITIPDTMEAVYEEDAGVLHVERCVSSYRQLAEQHGATYRVHEPVQQLSKKHNKHIVETTHGTYEGKTLIVCAGAWTKQLLDNIHVSLPLTPTRKTFAWFDAPEQYDARHFPAFVLERPKYCFYGFPSIDGSGFKVGKHDGGEAVDPSQPLVPFHDEDLAHLQTFVDTYMPQVGTYKYGKECKYNMTPDEDFIIDTLPTDSSIVIATGFSGHGFKFSSAIGELLAMMAMKQDVPYNLQRFSIHRFL